MLDLKFIRENVEIVKKAVILKRESLDVDQLLAVDIELTEIKTQLQALQAKRNAHSKKIPTVSPAERPALIEEGRAIGKEVDELKPKQKELEEKLQTLMYQVPQIPSSAAPVGDSEKQNIEIKKWGMLPSFSFTPLDHVQILERNQWAEFEKIGEVCGSRSYSLKNEMVLLEQAIHQFAMRKLMKKGFTLFSTPSMVREQALFGTGHFPAGRDQVYFLPDDDLYLSGTAEVQLNSLHGNQILNESDLPLLYAGSSTCFRREAGSYGRDVRGLIRVHQFMKVEQYIICKNDPAESEKWHQTLLQTSEEIVQELGLPYRIVECCTGDMGSGKVRMYDVECWVPSEETYRETHSCSALHDWQARRTNTRYRDREGKVHHVYTLNNTAVATPRLLVPFLENHQRAGALVHIPEVLRDFLGGVDQLGQAKG